MKKKLFQEIMHYANNKLLITVKRDAFDADECIGFPIKITDKYLLMTNIVDFHNEGYVLLNCDDITDAYSRESDSFYEKICISEGLQKMVDKFVLDVSMDMGSILRQFYKKDLYITIHCERENDRCQFFMGRIISISHNCVKFRSLDVDGTWDRKSDIIYFKDITMISFGDYYSKMFHKYIEGK